MIPDRKSSEIVSKELPAELLRAPNPVPYGKVRGIVARLPREIVGPKTRRRASFCDYGVAEDVRYEVYKIDLKPLPPARRGEFPQKVKRAALKAAGYKCQQCGATDRLEVDHVTPLQCGGEPTIGNAQVLCRRCHQAKTKQEMSDVFGWAAPPVG